MELPTSEVNRCFGCAGPPGEEDVHRTTLVFAFWDDEMKPVSGQPGSGPARLPPWRRRQAHESNVKLTSLRQDDNIGSAKPQPTGTRCGQDRALLFERWLADMESQRPCWTSPADPHSHTMLQQASTQVAFICPVWVKIEKERLTKKRKHYSTAEGVSDAHLPPLKFFLRSESEIYNTYNPV